MRTFRVFALITVILIMAMTGTQAFADCNEVSTNYWVCDGTTVGGYTLPGADETLVITAGSTFTGDINGGTGSDRIINDGLLYGTMMGQASGTSGVAEGNDTLINNGTILNCLTGSCGGGSMVGWEGDDTLINNGNLEGQMYGGHGNDTFVNRGTVFLDIGERTAFPPFTITYTEHDTIINGGTVLGAIWGDWGNDSITLELGANGGSDHYLLVDGGDADDTLVLAFDNADVDAAVLANASSGIITIDGETFEWRNFEHIVKGEPEDGRLNGGAEHNARTAAVYCSEYEDGGVIVYGIDENAEGYLLFSVSSEDAHAALEQAQATNEHVMIAEEAGQSLWALTSNELQIHDADGQYDFIFNPTICGIPLAS